MSCSLEFFAVVKTSQREFTTRLFYSDLDEAPERFSKSSKFVSAWLVCLHRWTADSLVYSKDVQSIGTGISADLSDVDMTAFEAIGTGNSRLVQLCYTIEVVLGQRLGMLRFRIKINERVVGHADIDFARD